MFGVDEVFVDPDEIDFEELDGDLDLDFRKGAFITDHALCECTQKGLFDTVEDVNVLEVNDFDFFVKQPADFDAVWPIKLNNILQ